MPTILQTRPEFEKFWGDLDYLVQVASESEGRLALPFLVSTVVASLNFENVTETIRKCCTRFLPRHGLRIHYGSFCHIIASSDSNDDLFKGSLLQYHILKPSQLLHPPGGRFSVDHAAIPDDVAVSEFNALLGAITSSAYLKVSVRDETWLLNEIIDIELDTSSRKATGLRLGHTFNHSLRNLPKWTRAVLRNLGIDDVLDSYLEKTALLDETFTYAAIFESSEDSLLSKSLRKLELIDCHMSKKMWKGLFRSTSIQKNLEELTICTSNRHYRTIDLSEIGSCRALKELTLDGSFAQGTLILLPQGSRPGLTYPDALGLRECCNLNSLSIKGFNLEGNDMFDFLPHLLAKTDCPFSIKTSLQRFVCQSQIDEIGWGLLAISFRDFKALEEVDISCNSSLTRNSVATLIQGVFRSETIFRLRLPTEYEGLIDEKLKHHLYMNMPGRRIVYRSPELMPALVPTLLEYASKKYPLTGVFGLLRFDLVATVFEFGTGNSRKRKASVLSAHA